MEPNTRVTGEDRLNEMRLFADKTIRTGPDSIFQADRDDGPMVKRLANSHDSRLRILTHVRHGLPSVLTEPDYELANYAELIESGYLDGWITVGADGRLTKVADLQITLQGEEFLEQQGDLQIPPPRALSKELYVLLECMSGYLLVLGFFFLLKTTQQTASAPPNRIVQTTHVSDIKKEAPPLASGQKAIRARHSQESPRKSNHPNWTISVCGLPPLE